MEREIWREREREGERGWRERLEREARWDLRHQIYRLGLKMGHSAHCTLLFNLNLLIFLILD